MISRMLFLALVCLTVPSINGDAKSTGPLPPLTPTAKPTKQSLSNEKALAQLAITMEEELLVDMLPFKPPFEMNKKQMAAILRLLKKAVKPVLKSERLRTMVITVDDFMQDLEYNQENKKYYAGMLDVAQVVYKELNKMYKDEQTYKATARTFESVSSIYRQSVLNNWIVEPVNNYVVQPINNWVLTPTIERISDAAWRVYSFLPGPLWVIDTEYVNPFDSWSETFNYYVSQISGGTSRARNILEVTANLLEEQEYF